MNFNSDKDNNSAVVSLGETHSDNAPQHLSATSSPPPPPSLNGVTVDEAPPHRASVHRCGSPPTGRSVSFMCGHLDSSETDGNCAAARISGRRQSGEQKGTATATASLPSVSVTSSPGTQYHVEDESGCKFESVGTEMIATTTCPSAIRACKCTSSPLSRLSDVEGCQLASGSECTHETRPARVSVTSQSDVLGKHAATSDCCVIHVSTNGSP